MKKIIIAIMLFCATDAYAENDNASTSKEYVDAAIADKQPTVPAAGANNVMTYDSSATDGIGTKELYDTNASYASQQNALVTAATANAAVQLAINGEFVCHEWNPNDNTDCWLWRIKDPVAPSRNLFDPSQILNARNWTENNGVYTGITYDIYQLGRMVSCNPCKPDTQYTLSYTITNNENFDNKAWLGLVHTDGSGKRPGGTSWKEVELQPGQSKHYTITSDAGKTLDYIGGGYQYSGSISFSDIQVEEGTVATPYQPYGQNTYLPQSGQ